LLTQEGTQHFIDDLKKQLAERNSQFVECGAGLDT